MKKPISTFISVLLILMSLLHILRLAFHISVTIGGIEIPMWASLFGTVIPATLALLLHRETKRDEVHT